MTPRRTLLSACIPLLGMSLVLAAAPRSGDVPQPVDMTPGSISDESHLLKADLDRPISISLDNQPALLAYNRINGIAGIQFGYVKGINPEQLVTMSANGSVRDALKALGDAAGIRFEVVGPTQMRVLAARKGPLRKPRTEPPPIKR